MYKKIFILFQFLFILWNCKAQVYKGSSELNNENNNKPKLVVGIVVDQMRYDYLTRFYSKFGNNGFKRLIKEGYNCKNNHFNYVPTYTGPGHASVYSGTTPKYHGIVGNYWYDKELKEKVYCAQDDSVFSVGTSSMAGKMSPHRLKVTTFADENRLFTQMRGKTIGISIKDRGAIMPAGHSANGSYWFDSSGKGLWITSSFYMDSLPKWVEKFNSENNIAPYLKEWDTYYNINTYTESGEDLNNFEGGFEGKETATFPYNLEKLSSNNGGINILASTPFGNSITTDFALVALDEEQLGKDNFTDVLTISYSCTDYVGHNFGVNSKEIEDIYIRLDLDLSKLLDALDKKVGKGEYTVFLTADHGAIHVPSYLQSEKIPAGYVNLEVIRKQLDLFLENHYKISGFIENISNNQIFLNRAKIIQQNLSLEAVQETIVTEIINYPNIYKAYTAKNMISTDYIEGIEALLQKGYNQKISGDVLFEFDPSYISYNTTGSTHGSALNYDTHVPLIFFGKGINHGETFRRTEITDIAPTISALLGIAFPNACIGNPLEFVLE